MSSPLLIIILLLLKTTQLNPRMAESPTRCAHLGLANWHSANSQRRGGGSRGSKNSGVMAPPPNALSSSAIHPVVREVTEDTPPDLLEGTMDLLVILPSQKSVRMTVNRRTPMMDLLIQVTTAHKINPGGHIVQVRNERGIELPYKPSTPIGALDTTTIEIVPKNRVNEYIIVKKPAKLANQPFEQTFRLQVHLPRNQLYVMRVSPKALLEEILLEVCQEKNLDHAKYEIRHPVKLDEKLPLSGRVGDFGLQELTVVSRNSRINSSVSAADIMALQEGSKGCLDSAFKHSRSSVGDSSVSSESAVSARGISPSRSDDSRSISPLPPVHQKLKLNNSVSNASSSSSGNSSSVSKSAVAKNNFNSQGTPATMQAPPRTKKRAAPPPPSTAPTPAAMPVKSVNTENASVPPVKPTPRKKDPPREPPKKHAPLSHQASLPIHHSRHSSDSSGYHESSILSEQHDPPRLDRQASTPAISNLTKQSGSTTNLTSVYSGSSTSLASSNGGGIRKRKAPKPPGPALKPQRETLEEEASTISTTQSESFSSVSQSKDTPTKSDKSRSGTGSGIEQVQVEVHVETPKKVIEAEQRRNERSEQHEKDIEVLSSSSASSLSGPSSSSGSDSTSSSPLPVDPPSTVSQNLTTPSESSISHLSNSSRNSPVDKSVVVDTAPTVAAVVEESSRPSSASNTQAMEAAPKPPPRTKPRMSQQPSLSIEAIDHYETETVKAPQPKPKPRPDRSSADTVLDDGVVPVPKPKPENVNIPQASANFPVPPSSANRNPLAKFGVKVLPDNALRERLEKMSKKSLDEDSLDKRNSSSVTYNSPSTKASSTSHANAGGSAKSKNSSSSAEPSVVNKSDLDKKESESSRGSVSKTSKAPPALSKSNYTGKGSVRSLKGLNESLNNQEKIMITDIQIDRIPGSRENSLNYESDNLEENLELFELQKSSIDSTSSGIPVKTKTSFANKFFKKRSITSTSSEDSSAISSTPPDFIPELNEALMNKGRSRKVLSVSNADDKEEDERMGQTESPRTRTLSDSKNNNKNKKSDIGKEGQLNRWQNFEALHELDDSAEEQKEILSKTNQLAISAAHNKNATATTTTTKISNKPTLSLSADDDNDFDTAHIGDVQDDPAIKSSGSEASYADSGIPATANVTPSPIDMDLDLDHENSKSRTDKDALSSTGSSRRSSLRSEQSDQWREILNAKLQKEQEDVEKAFESMMPDDFNEGDSKRSSMDNQQTSNFEMVRPSSMTTLASEADKNSLEDEQEQSIQLSYTTEEESGQSASDEDYDKVSDKAKSSSKAASANPLRKISKSESFSHKSEFEVVKMKRKTYSSSRDSEVGMSNGKGNSTSDLRKSSFVSSSEEDLSVIKATKRSPGSRRSSNNAKASKDQRTASMQNLNNPPDAATIAESPDSHLQKERVAKKEFGRSNKDSSPKDNAFIQKATSMMDIQGIQPDIAHNPDLMQKYQAELQAQLEQWKEQFLKKHMGLTKSGSFSTDPVENDESNDFDSEEIKSETQRVEDTSAPIKKEAAQVDWDEDDFDPEKPQIVHSVAAAAELHKPTVAQVEETVHAPKAYKLEDDEPISVVEKTEPEISTKSEAASIETSVESEKVKEEEADDSMASRDVFQRKQPEQRKEETTTVYKYAGPPTINMSTWGDRPKRIVSVKKDKDYIMGFGQQDPKTVTLDVKPTPAPITQRVNSFNGTSVASPPITPTVNKTATLPAPVKSWMGVGSVNGHSNSDNRGTNGSTTTSVPSVVSAWKQRLEQSEKERKRQPPPEIDIYGDGFSSTPSNGGASVDSTDGENVLARKALVNINKQAKPAVDTNTNIIIEEPPNAFSWSTPESNNKNSSKTPGKTLVNLNKTNKGFGASTETLNRDPEPVSLPLRGNNKTLPSKPGHSLVNINRARTMAGDDEPTSVVSIEVNSVPKAKSIVIETENSSGKSMQETKRFFQGIKPVESNGKEAPIPAVNMKNNIATIQRVFEQRQQQQQQQQQQMPMQRTLSSRDFQSSNLSSPASSGTSTPISNKTFLSEKSSKPHPHSSISSTEMVQKVLGKSNSFNIDAFRRTPSPASSTTSTSTMSSASPSSERHTPSPTISDGPNNTIRISTGSMKSSAPATTSTIKNVGNKSIIIVSSADDSAKKNETRATSNVSNNATTNSIGSNTGMVSNSIFKQQMKVNAAPQISIVNKKHNISSPPINNQSSKVDVNNRNSNDNHAIKVNVNGNVHKSHPPVIDINMTTPVSRPIVVEQSSKKITPLAFQQKIVNNNTKPSDHVTTPKVAMNGMSRSNSQMRNGTSVPPPPPPPMMDEKVSKPVGLAASGRSKSVSALTISSSGKGSNGGASIPTSPTGDGDPRSEIFNVIKNSGGNFGLRKTGSTMLLK